MTQLHLALLITHVGKEDDKQPVVIIRTNSFRCRFDSGSS